MLSAFILSVIHMKQSYAAHGLFGLKAAIDQNTKTSGI
jgi:hypothetical protein